MNVLMKIMKSRLLMINEKRALAWLYFIKNTNVSVGYAANNMSFYHQIL